MKKGILMIVFHARDLYQHQLLLRNDGAVAVLVNHEEKGCAQIYEIM